MLRDQVLGALLSDDLQRELKVGKKYRTSARFRHES